MKKLFLLLAMFSFTLTTYASGAMTVGDILITAIPFAILLGGLPISFFEFFIIRKRLLSSQNISLTGTLLRSLVYGLLISVFLIIFLGGIGGGHADLGSFDAYVFLVSLFIFTGSGFFLFFSCTLDSNKTLQKILKNDP